MARYRTYKPSFFTDEKLIECSVDARFCFLCLLPFLDDMGRRQYHPRTIKAEIFPADQEYTPEVVDALVQELAKVGVVELYDIGKRRYLRVSHFLRHQYVKKPTHCYIPPAPSEGPSAERCRCYNCNLKAARNGDDEVFLQELPHQYGTSGEQVGNSDGTSTVPVREEYRPEVSKKVSKKVQDQNQEQHQHQVQIQDQEQHQHPAGESNDENRRAERREVDEIAMRMVSLLNLPDSPLLLQTLTKSIEVKARSRNASVEWAGQHILGKAAVIAAESPPDDWTQWLFDSRYEYLIPGDPRLKDRRIEARPTCGGTRCSEGWEIVKVGDDLRLRRCPDCVRSWEDAGL